MKIVTLAACLVLFAGCAANPAQTSAPGPTPAPEAKPQPAQAATPAHAPSVPRTDRPELTSAAESFDGGLMGITNFTRVSFADQGADFDPTLTPDGKSIVFSSTQHRRTADLYVKAVDGRVVTQLTSDPADDIQPAVSPDGRFIAFASSRSGNWDIYVMPIAGGRAVQVTDDPAAELHPSWSPDGSTVVFCRKGETSGRWELWTVSPGAHASSSFIGFGLFPQWCPAAGPEGSDRILFQLARERGDRAFSIWTIDVKDGQASNPTEIASSKSGACINPAWSRDGRHIAYAEVPSPDDWTATPTGGPREATLWLINVDGTGKVKLSSGLSRAVKPAWGPADRLFFVADRSGGQNIWMLDAKSAVAAASVGRHDATASASEHEPKQQTNAEPNH